MTEDWANKKAFAVYWGSDAPTPDDFYKLPLPAMYQRITIALREAKEEGRKEQFSAETGYAASEFDDLIARIKDKQTIAEVLREAKQRGRDEMSNHGK